ncbi:S8 family serine peptidase [Flavihumibacter profundi]|uniref:S8 family serine peptidase n=1 Tax=Flavihumibacter profundi TaxID=2716883 RepID=UPI00374446AE
MEILPFSVTNPTTVYLKVVKAGGPLTGADVAYKYILFKGSGSILDSPNPNPSTIIGHANAKEAITVGAVQYNLTPAYGVAANLMKAEPFSSWGGPTNGIDNLKPDISAPDGVNTSVTLGDRPLLDINGNPYTDQELTAGVTPHYFFGTSAAAPHAAGMAALLLEARYRLNPSKPAFGYMAMRDTLKKTATNIVYTGEDPISGFDYKSGAGLLNAYKALLTEGNPTPIITQVTATQTSSGSTVINVVVDGNYLTTSTYISVDGSPVPTTVDLATKTLSAEIAPFTGNPAIKVCSPSTSELGIDGQCSNSLNILDANRTKITLRAKSYTKKYGEALPVLDYDLLIGSDTIPVDRTQPLPGGLTLAGLGLVKPGLNGAPDTATVHVTTAATSTSDAGNAQAIKVTVDGFSPAIPLQYAELYNYVFLDGGLSIEKLHINIKPKDQTITYGNEIDPVKFEYTTPGTTNLDSTVLDSIIAEHNRYIADGYALVRGFDESQLPGSNLAMMITETGLQNANGGATRANGGVTRANVVDISADALNYFLQNRLTNGGVTRANGIPFDNAATRANGGVTRANGGVTRANTVVYADAIINGFVVVSSNGGVTRANVSGGNPNAAANGGVTRANGGVTRANYITFTANGGVTRANVVMNSDPSATPYGFADISVDATNSVSVSALSNSLIQNGVLTNSGSDPVPLVNSNLFSANSNSNVAVLLDDDDITKGYVEGYISINMVTGLTVTTAGHPHKIVPGAYLPVSANYDITYGTGDLTVTGAPMTVTANNINAKYKDTINFKATVTGYVYNPETDALDDSTVFAGGINFGVSQVVNSVIVPYAGPVYPVGTYTITPLFTQPANYSVNPPQGTNGTLTINKADQTITVVTASPASANYGTSFTVAATASSGLPVTYTSAAPLSNTGATYTMTSGIDTGRVRYNQAGDGNFNPAQEIVAKVIAGKADLTINMNQSIYYFSQGGSLPAFSSTVSSLVPPDAISDNTYVTTSGIAINSNMAAGQYSVIRNVTTANLAKLNYYNLTNNSATLYVNPSGGNTKSVRPTLICIEQLAVPVNGMTYRARYSYQNSNSVPVYVPLGSDNYIILSPGATYNGNPPEVFLPGTYEFYIYFNGVKITWYLASIDKNKKTASTSDASSTSSKCTSGNSANLSAMNSGMDIVLRETIYPNPATNGQVYIEGDFSKVSKEDIIVVDAIGRQVRPAEILKLSPRKMRIGISNLANSQYYIMVNLPSGRKTFKFIKQ